MRKRLYTAAVLLAILLAGCAAQTPPDTSPEPSGAQQENLSESLSSARAERMEFTRDDTMTERLPLSEYRISVPEGMTLEGCAAADGFLYYWAFGETDSNFVRLSRLYRMDLSSEEVTEFCTIEGFPHWVNEFTANDDGLYWVLQSDGVTRIQHMDLSGGAPEDVRVIEESVTVLLECDQANLVWTEMTDQATSLYTWPTDGTGDVHLVSDAVLTDRVYAADGKTAFLESADGSSRLVVYDLGDGSAGTEIPVESGEPVSRLQYSGSGYLAWSGSAPENLYACRLADNTLWELGDSSDGRNVFSFNLWNSLVVVNDRNSGQLMVYDLDNKTCSAIASTGSENPDFITGKVMGDGWFVNQYRGGVLVGRPE